jgi:superfamily II DNA or RNA helicase
MLSPVFPVALAAPTTTAQKFVIGALGEYENRSLKQLIYNPMRNQMIIDIATQLIAQGNTPIIACIPGDDMLHPHHIAERLSEQTITDIHGKERLLNVVPITSSIAAATRQQYYAQLESGEIDGLTYIDVLTEGWDSQRANVIINARPTRSLVAARQRVGRILRNKPDGRPAIALDIVDRIGSDTAPQVSMADIFTMEQVKSGAGIGATTPEYQEQVEVALDALSKKYTPINPIQNLYTQYAVLLETLPQLTRGQAQIKQQGAIRTFSSAGRLYQRYAVDSFMLAHIKNDVEIRQVRSGYEAIDAYDEDKIHERITQLPDGGRRGHGVTVNERQYVGLQDFMNVIRHKLGQPDLKTSDIESTVWQVAHSAEDFYFTKRFRARTHRGVTLYTGQTMIEMTVAQKLIDTLASKTMQQIKTTE